MPAETRLSIRQRIIDAIKVRFTAIHQNNGFATNIGTHCFTWRDLDRAPFDSDAELADGGAINISDPDRDPGDGVLTAHDQVLTIEVIAAATADGYTPPDNHARRMEADILAAIGQDRKWTVDGTPLAKDTLPGKSNLATGHQGDRVAWVRLTFQILFRTQRFDPYTQ